MNDFPPRLNLFSCPCCGRKTLDELGHYDICPVCWWEDDGMDNQNADEDSGPNHITLTEARINFIRYGIYAPSRTDLLKNRKDAGSFELVRVFKIEKDRIYEEGTNWGKTL